jgi:hypothetical protein
VTVAMITFLYTTETFALAVLKKKKKKKEAFALAAN